MMRKVILLAFSTVLMLSACSWKGKEQTYENIKQELRVVSGQAVDDSEEEIKNASEQDVLSMIKQEIDTTQKGVCLSQLEFSSEMLKGDDGDCYYFRTKAGKVIFYKNDGENVCELQEMKEKQEIESFLKYGNHIYVMLHEQKKGYEFASIDIETGKRHSVKKFDTLPTEYEIIFYKDICYYVEYDNSIIRFDLDGKLIGNFSLGEDEDEKITGIQCIVDDKIYYTVSEMEMGGNTTIMRCNLDGTENEELISYSRGEEELLWLRTIEKSEMQIDNKYIYMLDYYSTYGCLYRIPLYGGKIQKVTEKAVRDFDLNEDNIFFVECTDEKKLYKCNGNLTKEECIGTSNYSEVICVGDYLRVKKDNEDDLEKISDLENRDYKPNSDYAAEYLWLTAEGEVVSMLNGVGLREEDYVYCG